MAAKIREATRGFDLNHKGHKEHEGENLVAIVLVFFVFFVIIRNLRPQYSTSTHRRSRELFSAASQIAISLCPSRNVEKSPPGRVPAMKPYTLRNRFFGPSG